MVVSMPKKFPDSTFKIESNNIILRRLNIKDVSDNYISWLNNPVINRFLECRHISHTFETTYKYVESLSNDESLELLMGIFLKNENKHIGNIKLGEIDWLNLHSHLGILIGDSKEWGKGYATNAIRLMSDFAVNNLGLNTLVAGCYEENLGSYRAFVKANWKYVGRIPNYWETNEGYRSDQILLSFEK